MKCFALGSGPGVHYFSPTYACRKRKCGRQSLAEANNVWKHAKLIACEQRACAVEPCIDLVEYQEDFVCVAHMPEHPDEIERRNQFAASSLTWLDDQAPDRPLTDGLDDLVFDRFKAGTGAIRET